MNIALARIQDLESPLSRFGSPSIELTAAYERIDELEAVLRIAHIRLIDSDLWATAERIDDALDPHRVRA